MKNREFKYRGVTFHLNDNNTSPLREFEGRYRLLFWHEGYERWMEFGCVNSKKEAQEWVEKMWKGRYGAYA